MAVRDFYEVKRNWNFLKLLILALVLIALILVVGTFISVYYDYIEINEIGGQYLSVFWTNFSVMAIVQSVSFIFIFLLFYFSTVLLRRNIRFAGSSSHFLNKNIIVALISFILAFLAGRYISVSLYQKYLLMLNSTSFGISDPIFAQDIGYYFFQRPFWISIIESFSTVWFLITAFIVFLYFVTIVRPGEKTIIELFANKRILKHVFFNIIIWVLVYAVSYKFRAENILFSTFSGATGAGYTEVKIWMNYYRIFPFLLVVISVLTLYFLLKSKWKHALVSVLILPAVLILASLVAAAIEGMYVSPNEAAIQSPYIKNNIEYTRMAYGLDKVVQREYAISQEIDNADLEQSYKTIENIRIIDFPATLTVTNQLQGLRNYYKFQDLDVGIYDIHGKKTAVAIGAREIYKENLEGTAKNYINEKFRYTHGYGIVMSPLNKVTVEGQPAYFIKDIAPKQTEGIPFVSQPRIYFGELTDDYVIVNTKNKELDYSEGNNDIEFSYDGNAGIKMNLLNRLLYSLRFADFRMLISSQITSDSRLLLNRNVIERAHKIAPFLQYDSDPHIIVADDGTLQWVIDAYTVSNQHPYSQFHGEINYIRNSVKVVIDAYQGNMNFYIIDDTDPMIQTYSKIYPQLFEQKELPESITKHTKYPENLFLIQSDIYAKYHTTNPMVFYNKSDLYAFANEKYQGDIKPIDPYYSIMQLEEYDKDDGELVLMLPFTLVNRDNMVAWFTAGSEGDNYGKLVSYTFPKDINVYGPLQIENKIDNDPDISREMSLWSTGGSKVIRGSLIVIPIRGSLLYIEPVYITSNNQSSLPELKRVIAAFGDKVVMDTTIENALKRIWNQVSLNIEGQQLDTENALEQPVGDQTALNQAKIAYEKVTTALHNADWKSFGEAMSELGEAMKVLTLQN